MMKSLFLFAIMGLISTIGIAQNHPNTKSFDEAAGSPAAAIEDVSCWIQGSWTGEALGGICEEVWTAPLGGSMMCTFKLVVDGEVQFYELCTISEEGETLLLRVKHYSADLQGWEEKDESVEFKLVELAKDKAYFDDFTFERVSEDAMNIYVVFEHEGVETEMKFEYRRM